MSQTNLPKLGLSERKRVSAMNTHLIAMIKRNQSPMSFRHFMQEVLYAPKLGYYVSNKTKLGEQGDFMTAPMSSSLFGQTFALQFAEILKKLGEDAVIVEFGAGTGKFALDCLQKLKQLKTLPKTYYIIELSPDLKLQQQEILKKLDDYYANIHWLTELPSKKLNAIVFANEVLDAMPIELVHFNHGNPKQMMVAIRQNEFIWHIQDITKSDLITAVHRLPLQKIQKLQKYQTEVNLWIAPWLQSVRDILSKGVVFICDYGYQRDLYYSEDRVKGTLQCYYKHHAHDNPLIYAGVQDITAHVDFTTVAEAAEQLGFVLDGYATQGNFLSKSGLLTAYQQALSGLNEKETLTLNQEMKLLVLSTELGENFKVMGLSYQFDEIIEPFDDIDISYLL